MATTSPAADIALVRARLSDENANFPFLSDGDIDEAIQAAVVTEYSSHRPLEVLADLAGDGGAYYRLDNLADWVENFTDVVMVEYPITDPSTDTNSPEFLDPVSDWEIHRVATNYYLHLVGRSPGAGETIRVTLTKPHVLTDATDTIYSFDKTAVLDLAASICCLYAATRSAHSHDPSIRNTGVKRGESYPRWKELSDMWRKRYLTHMGIKEGEVLAASAIGEWDVQPSSGIPWLTHGRRRWY